MSLSTGGFDWGVGSSLFLHQVQVRHQVLWAGSAGILRQVQVMVREQAIQGLLGSSVVTRW